MLLGDRLVGKTTILKWYCTKRKSNNLCNNSLQVDFGSIIKRINNISICLQLWDIISYEIPIAKPFSKRFEKCNGFIIVFDLSKRDSFINVDI